MFPWPVDHDGIARATTFHGLLAGARSRPGLPGGQQLPIEKYAQAAEGLAQPSSAARALLGGAEHIERVDCLVRRIARQQGLQCDTPDEIVTLVDEHLGKNCAAGPAKRHGSIPD